MRQSPTLSQEATPTSFENVLGQIEETRLPAFNGEVLDSEPNKVDLKGFATEPFSKEIQQILTAPVELKDVECKPGISILSYWKDTEK